MIFEIQFIKDKYIEANDQNYLINSLASEKNKIDKYEKKWSKIKKIIHEYEIVYTSSNISKNISKITPISRSYFKIIEMINKYKLFDIEEKVNVFCMAEAPGGFIQGFLDYKDKIKIINANSLLSHNKSIPYWNKSLLNNDMIKFQYGKQQNGDIYDINNILSIIKSVGKQSVHFITGDGGFDYSNDYNKQESNSLPLIYSEIFLALNLQKKNGVFICKLFDIFLKETTKLIYILSLSYKKIYFHKPCISRLSNSEKYIVCTGFKGYNTQIINYLYRSFHDKKLKIKIDSNFENNVKEFNQIYTDIQIKQINRGIDLINSTNINFPSKKQIDYALDWCNINNIPINNNCEYLNRTRTL